MKLSINPETNSYFSRSEINTLLNTFNFTRSTKYGHNNAYESKDTGVLYELQAYDYHFSLIVTVPHILGRGLGKALSFDSFEELRTYLENGI